MTAQSKALEEWLAEFVQTETAPERVKGWSTRISDAILAGIPEIADDAVFARDVRAAVRAHWLAFLADFGEPEHEFHLVQPAVTLAAEMAQRRLNLVVLFKIYRVAQQATWAYITDVVQALPLDAIAPAEVLVSFWDRASVWIDASISASIDVYQRERDRIAQGTAAQRFDLVREAIEGRAGDPRMFSRALGGYPVSGFNTALLLHAESHEGVSSLATVATQLAADLGSRQPLVISPGGRDLWCWVGTRSAPDLGGLARRSGWLRDERVVVCAGTPGEGLDGFALSHREAAAAQRVVFRASGAAAFTTYPDVEILVLLNAAANEARRFAERRLGKLAESTESMDRLRSTVHTLLLCGGNYDEAARRLVVHKNTVRYRVGQAEELLGHSVYDAPTELELALRYFQAFAAPAEDSVTRPPA